MRCRCYCSGIWHLNLGTSILGRCFRLFLLLLLVIVCLAIIFITLKESHNIWQLNFRAESHSLAGKTFDVAEATNVRDRNMNYGIVVDCGSSGSRVFVYFWPQHDGNPDNLLDIQLMRDANIKPVVKKVEPGLSAYSDDPSRASEYLKPLLKFAAEHIPIKKHKETPLYIMATAGMRLLSKRQQEAILNNLRVDIPMGFDFLFTDTQLEVISGKQEGIYAWVAINYVRGKFDHGIRDDPLVVVELPGPDRKTHVRKRTVGIVDMGGASVQIAFEVPESVRFEYKKDDVPKELVTEFNLGCVNSDRDHHYRVYVTTFLGFGGNAVRKKYERMLVTTNSQSDSYSSFQGYRGAEVDDPCLPSGLIDKVTINNSSYLIKGTGLYMQCQHNLIPFLNQSAPCMKEPCSINGVFQPEISSRNSEFYGFSEFYYTMEDVLRLGGKYDYMKFEKAAKGFCETPWSTVEDWYKQKLYPKADEHRIRYQCFKSAWMSTILHDGLKLPKVYKHFTSVRLLDGKEIHWSLGALLYKTRFYPLREIEKHQNLHHFKAPSFLLQDVSHAYYALLVCFVVVLTAICLYLRRLRLVRRPDLRRVPTMSYFMTEEGQMEEGILVNKNYSYSFAERSIY